MGQAWEGFAQSGFRYNYGGGLNASYKAQLEYWNALGIQAGPIIQSNGVVAGRRGSAMTESCHRGTFVRRILVIQGASRLTDHIETRRAAMMASKAHQEQLQLIVCEACSKARVQPNFKMHVRNLETH